MERLRGGSPQSRHSDDHDKPRIRNSSAGVSEASRTVSDLRTKPGGLSGEATTVKVGIADDKEVMLPTQASSAKLHLLEEEKGEEQLNNVQPAVTHIKVAADSGAAVHVTPPDSIPAGVLVEPNTSGLHYTGAGGDPIIKHGTATTLMTGTLGKAAIKWGVADVERPLQSVSATTGPPDGPGVYDMIFSNKKAVIVPAGAMEKILASNANS